MSRFVKISEKFVKGYAQVNGHIATLVVGALAITMMFQVFFRYVLNRSLAWSDEFGSFMLVWVTMFGSVIVLYEGKHLAITMLVERLKTPFTEMVKICANLVSLLLVMVVLIYLVPIMQITVTTGTISIPAIPRVSIYSAMPIAFFGMAIILISDILKDIAGLVKRTTSGKKVA